MQPPIPELELEHSTEMLIARLTSACSKVQKELHRIREAEKDAARRSDMLAYQINEIESAQPTPG